MSPFLVNSLSIEVTRHKIGIPLAIARAKEDENSADVI
jgi:hypothetical protein